MWLKVHEIEETTRKGYELYRWLHIGPALGAVPVGKITVRPWNSSAETLAAECFGLARLRRNVAAVRGQPLAQ